MIQREGDDDGSINGVSMQVFVHATFERTHIPNGRLAFVGQQHGPQSCANSVAVTPLAKRSELVRKRLFAK